ncbi:MAG: outer membrane protein assembly factor BamD [Bacteroidales bacterium]|nr:outer membrane protein assembly factor BamD [Bacteroidales bacterium]
MKRAVLLTLLGVAVLASCGEYNAVTKYADQEYKYEYAKSAYVNGRYTRAYELFNDLIIPMKGSGYGEECLYLMAMSAYLSGDYETASTAFKKYYQSYPRGLYVEEANYYSGLALYEAVPDPRLDQATTLQAISELSSFLEHYPYTRLKEQTQEMIQRLQDHLIEKEYLSCKLYYDLGSYIGNSSRTGGSNYEACIIAAENALRDYPYASSERREQFMILILRSRYYLAVQSVEEKRLERFRQTIDEYYGFANEFPESKFLKEAQGYLTRSQKVLKGQPLEED